MSLTQHGTFSIVVLVNGVWGWVYWKVFSLKQIGIFCVCECLSGEVDVDSFISQLMLCSVFWHDRTYCNVRRFKSISVKPSLLVSLFLCVFETQSLFIPILGDCSNHLIAETPTFDILGAFPGSAVIFFPSLGRVQTVLYSMVITNLYYNTGCQVEVWLWT